MIKLLITGVTGQDGSYLANFIDKTTLSMELKEDQVHLTLLG